MTKIEWADETWNPVVGCSLVSPGCVNCYALRLSHRMALNPRAPAHYAALTTRKNGRVAWSGQIAEAPDAVWSKPARTRRPTLFFVNSMGDVFHEAMADGQIERVWQTMAATPNHTFIVLTKRAARMQAILRARAEAGRPTLPNVWVGVSAEDQRRADQRVPMLLATPAARRVVSAEPLLGPVRLPLPDAAGALDWVIAGGESGPGARPMQGDWARELRDDCQRRGIAFFFKQWGEYADGQGRIGKRRAGRLLDGVLHDARPPLSTA